MEPMAKQASRSMMDILKTQPKTWEEYQGLLGPPEQFRDLPESAFTIPPPGSYDQYAQLMGAPQIAQGANMARQAAQTAGQGISARSPFVQEMQQTANQRGTIAAGNLLGQLRYQHGADAAQQLMAALGLQSQIDATRGQYMLGRGATAAQMRGIDAQIAPSIANALAGLIGNRPYSREGTSGFLSIGSPGTRGSSAA